MDLEIEYKWRALLDELADRFGNGIDMTYVMLLVGIQEFGQGFKEYSKDEKMKLIHYGSNKLLSLLGYFEITGYDDNYYPFWKRTEGAQKLDELQESQAIKQAAITYFGEQGFLENVNVNFQQN